MKRTPLVIVGRRASALAFVPLLGLPAFYDSLLYLVLHWIVLATSWNILSGYTGYFSFGHGAFFGAGLYTTRDAARASYDWPFLWTLPVAAAVAGAARRGARRGRVPRQGRARRAVRAADAGGHLRASARSSSTRRSTAAPASR